MLIYVGLRLMKDFPMCAQGKVATPFKKNGRHMDYRLCYKQFRFRVGRDSTAVDFGITVGSPGEGHPHPREGGSAVIKLSELHL